MDEYIDKHEAYTLLKDLEAAYIYPPVREAYEKAARRIDQIKAADVHPVLRGKWESSQRTIETGTVYCSNCAIEYYVSDLQTVGDCNGIVHYCPNCGARMIQEGDTNG